MAFRGFQHSSGPARPPSSQFKFGDASAPPKPTLSNSSSTPSFRATPPSAGAGYRPRSSPSGFQNLSTVDVSYPMSRAPRPNIARPTWENRNNGSFFSDKNVYTYQRPAAQNGSTASTMLTQGRHSGIERLNRPRSPSFLADGAENFGNNNLTGRPSSLPDPRKLSPLKSPSPPSFLNLQSNVHPTPRASPRPTAFPAIAGSRSRSPVSYADLPNLQEPSLKTLDAAAYIPPRMMPVKNSSTLSSPPFLSSKLDIGNNIHNKSNPFQRPSISTTVSPALQTEPFALQSQTRRIVTPSSNNNDLENFDVSRPSVSKRTRSPPAQLRDREFQEVFNPALNDADRETQAKAKRMARFKIELREDEHKSFDAPFQKVSGSQPLNSAAKKAVELKDHSDEATRQNPNDNSVSDYEAMESSNAIIGLCPDMCPESERAERERKGDLDQYERLEGDRNQTDRTLAVKKYTRTAEREATLIRPMPILEKTIQYLLSLLNNPYDDKFLGIYNFLWDRMRAIRMDLRMQHIFNQGAISMLEQMIRLHILAMHELCEYTKGEGFSEGFDAHLNIEQMNKTSVELFQMYDDHRKKGIDVQTEKEFRGYYALLKLDKHPGYKVEPAELSLDLAKMTPELRQKPEILFAREVARACRTGNFVAFFRLARKATYLQACLMHAHFAKLRTQALAALHGGLLIGQGIPISQVSQWLGLEEDDVGSLLEYHGFTIKDFDVSYMVKEGPFFNNDKDYPTKCSNLVHSKKSRSIADDIKSSTNLMPVTNNKRKVNEPREIPKDGSPVAQAQLLKKNSLPRVVDVNMIDSKPAMEGDHLSDQLLKNTQTIGQPNSNNYWVPNVTIPTWSYPSTLRSSPVSHITKEIRIPESVLTDSQKKSFFSSPRRDSPKKSVFSSPSPRSPKSIVPPFQMDGQSVIQDSPGGEIHFDQDLEPPSSFASFDTDYVSENSQLVDVNEFTETNYDKEVAEAKLRLIIRLWKRRTSKIKDLRERRVFAANAARNLLSLGVPIQSNKHVPNTHLEFNINQIVRDRYEKHEKCWSPLNVSEAVADQLCQRNPEASCICFKLIVCSQMNVNDIRSGKLKVTGSVTNGLWLRSKLIPDRELDDDLLVVSSNMALWRTWTYSESCSETVCCLSVVKDVGFEGSAQDVTGANAVLFVFDDRVSLELQRERLQNLLMLLTSGSRLPLLILCDSCETDAPDSAASVASRLDLDNVDRTRISDIHVVCLSKKRELEHSDGFQNDDQLRNGLRWLASESLIQPVLHSAELRVLVLNNLKSSFDNLVQMNVDEMGPEHCVAAFNWALDRSVQVVVEAAKGNPTGWPSPEICLLDKSSREYRACELYLPSIGWSSSQRTEELVSALTRCKLSALNEDLTWLHRGSYMGEDLEKHGSLLENCLVRYLTESVKILGLTLAKQEVRLILQKNTRLELRNSSFYLIPDWVSIFQRIFNWQLMSIANGKHWTIYLPRLEDEVPQISAMDTWMPDTSLPSAYSLDKPSLEELVEVVQQIPEAGCPLLLPTTVNNQTQLDTNYLVTYDRHSTEDQATDMDDTEIVLSSHVLPNTSSELEAVAKREADRLSELLDSCNILQNSISKKLSLYF